MGGRGVKIGGRGVMSGGAFMRLMRLNEAVGGIGMRDTWAATTVAIVAMRRKMREVIFANYLVESLFREFFPGECLGRLSREQGGNSQFTIKSIHCYITPTIHRQKIGEYGFLKFQLKRNTEILLNFTIGK
jgi:hypothetical protein